MNKQFFSNNYKKVCVLGLTAIFITGLISGLFVSTETVFADSNGPRNAGTGTDMSDIGTISWSHPDRIIADDTNYATADVPEDGKITHYLKGTNYGFSIPSGATIDGIEVAINRQSSGQSSPFLRDNVVKLVKAGTVTGDNKAVTGTNWPTFSLETATYGDSSDKWGTTWTSTDINNVNFGVVLSAKNSNTGHNRTATVDYIQITVYYTPACTPTTWYHDGDADGFGDASGSTSSCTQPTGYVSNSTDCDDTNSAVNPGATEVCDGIDNDCDLTIDEGALWTNKGQACSVGQGICQASGTYICDAGHPAGPTICSATPGSSSPETCNGLDDDCDGQVDEGNPGGGSSCNTGLQGVCATGNLTCTGGALTCIQNVQSSTEVCNGIDDDCDGTVDEGGVCSVPTMIISASKVICDNEADLPNWGTGGPNITVDTASEWVAQHPTSCHLEDWGFEWAYEGISNPGDTLYGPAGLPDWHLFNVNSPAQITDLQQKSKIWVREVLENGYIPFTYGPEGQHNTDNYSAELYCHTDVLNYDNYDYIGNTTDTHIDDNDPQLGQTYYCVGFNTSIKYNCDREKWQCAPSREGQYPNENDCLTACQPICGDGTKEGKEECDGQDGVTPGKNFCTVNCELKPIYDGQHSCPQGTVKGETPLIGPIQISATDPDGENINVGLGNFLLEVTGTFKPNQAEDTVSDAGYTTIDNWANLATQYGIHGTPPDYAAHALLSDFGNTNKVGVVDWGQYNPDHVYTKYYEPSTNWTRFVIGDRYSDWFDTVWQNQTGMSDNSGSLILNIYTCDSITPTGSITACKYYDTNKDGEYDQGTDTPLAWNITVWHEDQPTTSTSATTNLTSGCVTFNDLPYGTYTVHEEQRTGWVQTAPKGPNGELDMSPTVYLNSENSHPTINFLNYETATSGSLTICKYEDKGTIGQYEEGIDLPLAWNMGVDYPNDGGHLDTRTNPDTGCVTIEGLNFGQYFIYEDTETGFRQTYPLDPNTYTVVLDAQNLDASVYFLNFKESPTQNYSCDISTWTCSVSETGQYNTSASCDAACHAPVGPTGSYVPLVLGATTQQGQVAGASTACNPYLLKYIKLGASNDPEEVKKLQSFLNEYLGLDLPISGIYDQATYEAVKQFQLLMKDDVLAPWVAVGCLPNIDTPTGYVYRTTKWTINNFFCPELKPDVSDEVCFGYVVGLGEQGGEVLGEATTTPTTTETTLPGETTTTETTGETGTTGAPENGVNPSYNWLWYLIGIIVIGGAVYLVYSRRKK